MGGGGRAGTVYAAWLVFLGQSLEEVLAHVPGVEKDVQRAFLSGFATAL
jgi:protein-tyrosine phosphatase